jgi:hypothetical protein
LFGWKCHPNNQKHQEMVLVSTGFTIDISTIHHGELIVGRFNTEPIWLKLNWVFNGTWRTEPNFMFEMTLRWIDLAIHRPVSLTQIFTYSFFFSHIKKSFFNTYIFKAVLLREIKKFTSLQDFFLQPVLYYITVVLRMSFS